MASVMPRISDHNGGWKWLHSMPVPRLTAELGWIIGGQAIATLGSLVGVRLLTGVVNPAIYGQIAIGMTVVSLVTQILAAPLINSAARFYAPAREEGSLASLFSTLRRAYWLIVSIAATAVVAGGSLIWKTHYAQYIPVGVFAVGFSLVSGINATFDGVQNASRQRIIVAWHQAASTWVRFLLAVALVVALGPSSAAVFGGYIIASIIVLGSQYYFFHRSISPLVRGSNRQRSWTSEVLKYSSPFAMWGIFTWAQAASDRWALTLYDAPANVGRYAVLFQIGYYPISILSSIVMQLAMPIIFERAGSGNDAARLLGVYRIIKVAAGCIVAVGLCLALAGLVCGRLVFALLVAPEYRSVYRFLPIMAAAACVFFAAQFLGLALMSSNKSYRQLPSKVGTAVFAVVVNFALAAFHGIAGVVWGMLLSSTVFFVWTLWLVIDEGRALEQTQAHGSIATLGDVAPPLCSEPRSRL